MENSNENKEIKTFSKNGGRNRGNNKSGKGRKPQSKGSNKCNNSGSTTGQLNRTGRDNDPNWYFLDPRLADQASAFTYNNFLGVAPTINVNIADNTIETPVELKVGIPEVLVITMNPSPGKVDSMQDGINLAALKTYSLFTSKNNKTARYAPQDITMLTLALGDIVSLMEHVRRMFGVAFTYNQQNRTMPIRLLQGMGVDWNDLLSNIATYRMQFNSVVTSVNKIPFPANIAYIAKCRDLYQKVYVDNAESPMAQVYIVRPEDVWVLNDTYNEQGAGLIPTQLVPETNNPPKMSFYLSTLGDMIESLMTSSVYNYIYSDVLNYADRTGLGLFYLDYLDENYKVIPEYNRNFLMQIHNTNVIGRPAKLATGTDSGIVSCNVNKNLIVYSPWFRPGDESGYLQDLIVDLDTPNPSVVDRIEATRFMSPISEVKSVAADEVGRYYELPDHYAVKMLLFSGSIELNPVAVYSCVDNANYFSNVLLTQFDWGPIQYVLNSTNTTLHINSDLNYFTVLDKKWFRGVNVLIFQALFEMR